MRANLDWIFLHQGRNVLCWLQDRVAYKEKSFQKNMVSNTCTLQIEVRTPTCSLHTFLTDNMCQPYPSCGGQGLALPFFVQTCSGRWRSRAQFVSHRAEIDYGKADFLIPSLTCSASLSPMNAFLWGNVDCFCIFFCYITGSYIS